MESSLKRWVTCSSLLTICIPDALFIPGNILHVEPWVQGRGGSRKVNPQSFSLKLFLFGGVYCFINVFLGDVNS